MKIVVCVRTLNESKNIERFCKCYDWADEILVSDGGSSDNTVELARKFSNCCIYHFPDKVWHTDKVFSNPRGKHINFLIDRAIYREADWIIFDDCDCVPTLELQKHGRNLLVNTVSEVFAYRMFILEKNKWFPRMCMNGQGLWAWRASVPVRADESSYTISMIIPKDIELNLAYPYALLHYFYPDEETFLKKKEQYVFTGEVDAGYNPRTQFGPIEPLPDWAKYE